MACKSLLCPICSSGDESFSIQYINSEFPFLKGNQDIFSNLKIRICKNCGFGWSFPYINKTKLDEFYASVYRDPRSVYYSSKPVANYNDFSFDPRAISQILLAKTLRDFKENDTFLDIGCGRGISFWTAKKLLPKMRFFGVEPDDFSHPSLKSLGVQIYPVLFNQDSSSAFNSQKFDLILMSHVLEHYNGNEIIPILESIHTILSDDGIFLCEVPNADFVRHQQMRHNDAPHLTFFNEKSIRIAMEKSELNLRFIDCCSQKYFQWWEDYVKKASEREKSNPAKSRLKGMLAWLASHFPDSPPKKWLRKFYGKTTAPNVFDFLSLDVFNYGRERTCIRVIASK